MSFKHTKLLSQDYSLKLRFEYQTSVKVSWVLLMAQVQDKISISGAFLQWGLEA